MIVRYFATERAAQLWAWEVAYARRVSKVRPLQIVRVAAGQWGVDNPDFQDDLYVLDARGRVERKACATTVTTVDTSRYSTTGRGEMTSLAPADSDATATKHYTRPGYRRKG